VSIPGDIRVSLMLCDAAQVVANKLYILGGGWSYLWLVEPGMPVTMALALDVSVPWELGNRPLAVNLRLVDEDNEDVTTGDDNAPVAVEGQLVAGRGPLARPGTELKVPLALPIPPLALDTGGYVWVMTIDGNPVARVPFQIGLLGQGPGGQG
jgi:hypothetical protein